MKLTVWAPVLAVALWLGILPKSSASPFDFFEIARNGHFIQETALAPTNSTEWLFNAHFCCTLTGGVTTLTVDTPTGYTLEESAEEFYFIDEYFTTLEELDAAYPPGAYTFTAVAGTLAPASATVTYPAQSIFPTSIPFFTGNTMERLAGLDPSAPFTFTWNQMPAHPAVTYQFVSLSIYPVGPGYHQPAFLTNSGTVAGFTSVTVPAGTLSADTPYRVVLYFWNEQNTPNAGFGDFSGIASASYSTEARFTTQVPAGAPGGPHAIFSFKGRQHLIGNHKSFQFGRRGYLVFQPDTGRGTEIVAFKLGRTNKVYAVIPMEDYVIKRLDGRKNRTHTVMAKAQTYATPLDGRLLESFYLRGRNASVDIATGIARSIPRTYYGWGREIVQDEDTGASASAESRANYVFRAKPTIESNDANETFDAAVARLANEFAAKGFRELTPDP